MEILQDNPTKGESGEDMYMTKYGTSIARMGKVFSYTFWRMQMNNDIFWSVQGNDFDGSSGGAWIATRYFGPAERAGRFVQEITLTHPIENKIQMRYSSILEEGRNCVFISKNMVHHFKNEDNSFNFDFRITRARKKSRRRC